MSEDSKPTELELLKKRADLMGVVYHPKIGVDKLRAKLSNENEAVKEESKEQGTFVIETSGQRKARLRKDASRLVRINVTCMNPAMKEHEGMIYTVSNSVVGTFKKYVPFNTTDGWHVPSIIYKHMKERECQVFHNGKGPRGEKIKVKRMIPELNIQNLDALTPQELKDLGKQQAMANNLD